MAVTQTLESIEKLTNRGESVDTDFMQDGACKSLPPDFMYPENGKGVREAQVVCEKCRVKGPCLEYAVNTPEIFGVWGGESERARRRIRLERGLVPVRIGKVATAE